MAAPIFDHEKLDVYRLAVEYVADSFGMMPTPITSTASDPCSAGKEVAYTVVTRGKLLGRSIRTVRWRYAEWGSSDVAELYDLQDDPREDHNLASKAQYQKQRGIMKRLLAKTQQRAGAQPD